MKPMLLCFLEKFRCSGVKCSIEFDGSRGCLIKYDDMFYDGAGVTTEEALENALVYLYKEEARRQVLKQVLDSLKEIK